MKTFIRFSLLFVIISAGVLCGNVQAQYLHPKVTQKQVSIRNAVILPAKVEITKESAKGTEMMVGESQKISLAVSDAVADTLKYKKIGVSKDQFQPAGMNEDSRYVLADIQGRYDALLPKLLNNSDDIKKARFTLGDEVMLLNVEKNADVLVFIRGRGRIFTKGKTAFSVINMLNLSFDLPRATITVGIVDARSGEVLAFTRPKAASNILKDPQALNRFITDSLKKLPAS